MGGIVDAPWLVLSDIAPMLCGRALKPNRAGLIKSDNESPPMSQFCASPAGEW
jgi:hypothetical protein